jgi:hypothetical protein
MSVIYAMMTSYQRWMLVYITTVISMYVITVTVCTKKYGDAYNCASHTCNQETTAIVSGSSMYIEFEYNSFKCRVLNENRLSLVPNSTATIFTSQSQDCSLYEQSPNCYGDFIGTVIGMFIILILVSGAYPRRRDYQEVPDDNL